MTHLKESNGKCVESLKELLGKWRIFLLKWTELTEWTEFCSGFPWQTFELRKSVVRTSKRAFPLSGSNFNHFRFKLDFTTYRTSDSQFNLSHCHFGLVHICMYYSHQAPPQFSNDFLIENFNFHCIFHETCRFEYSSRYATIECIYDNCRLFTTMRTSCFQTCLCDMIGNRQ